MWGDQNNETIPETPVCAELGIALIDGLETRYRVAVGFERVINNGAEGNRIGMYCTQDQELKKAAWS